MWNRREEKERTLISKTIKCKYETKPWSFMPIICPDHPVIVIHTSQPLLTPTQLLQETTSKQPGTHTGTPIPFSDLPSILAIIKLQHVTVRDHPGRSSRVWTLDGGFVVERRDGVDKREEAYGREQSREVEVEHGSRRSWDWFESMLRFVDLAIEIEIEVFCKTERREGEKTSVGCTAG
jgi:hypothetical protein